IVMDLYPEDLEIDTYPLHRQLTSLSLWHSFSSRRYTMHNFDEASDRKLPLSARQLRSLWSSPIPLPARDLWYRLLCRKLPTAKALSLIGRAPSATCRLCFQQIDSIPHFVVHCPSKWSIWVEVLSCFRPSVYFSPTQIFRML
ncbi:hypothetical protein BD560DRAFT_307024, partial [Blakeslea trispora]